MALCVWSDDYSVGIKEIDEQHKRLFDIINELHNAMKEAKAKSVLGKVIKDLIDYTEFHFSSEEILLKNCKYPDFNQHKLIHDQFTVKVKEFEQKYLNGTVLLSQEIVQFLKDWLIKHIKESDKQYSMFIIKANVA
jgi:hemerythrin-like metal-binding protein